MQIVICDDEILLLDDLERRIGNYAFDRNITIDVRRFCSTTALLAADLSKCDLLLLDVEMPEVDGLEAARRLRKAGRNMLLIFVTGFLEYSPKGYEVNAFRYILKGRLDTELPLYLDQARDRLRQDAQIITVQTESHNVDVALKHILYFEGTSRRRVLMHLQSRPAPVVCMGKLDTFDQALSTRGFLRLQRSFLANMRHIEQVKNYHAKLYNGLELKISEQQYAEVKRQFLEWRGMCL